MWNAFMAWRRKRLLTRRPLPDAVWTRAVAQQPLMRMLSFRELARLRELATILIAEKRFVGARGLLLTEEMKTEIALLACLPILELGIDWYGGWSTIIVYPDEFYPRHEEIDEDGIYHVDASAWSGEAQDGGPVILSWAGIEADRAGGPGSLVIHEFAHKLDMRSGGANGCPPLHQGMSGKSWQQVFRAAWADLRIRAEAGEETQIDPYAASDPAEFFAVACEWFFTAPAELHAAWPCLYDQLMLFFRRDTLHQLAW